MKIGVDEWCYHNSMLGGKMTVEDLINRCGELGVAGLGLDYMMLSSKHRKDPKQIKELLINNNLELVFGFGMPFALPDLAFRVMENRRDEMFDLAHEFNAKIIRVVGGVILPNPVQKPLHISVSKSAEIADVARRLKEFTADASLEGLTVAMENHTEYTSGEMLEIVDRVGSESFKLTLDTGNAIFVGEDPVETVEKLAPHSVHTHIKDLKKVGPFITGVPLGRGDIDIPLVVRALKESGYAGQYCVEVNLGFWEAGKEDISLQESIEYLYGVDESGGPDISG